MDQEENKTTPTDFEILHDAYREGNNEINTKFLRQALLQIISWDAALKLEIMGGYPEGSKTRNSHMGVFQIEELTTRTGDYRLTMYQSGWKPNKKIVMEYYEFRPSNGMSFLGNAMINAYANSGKGFLDYIKDKV